mgnify:CR=1 FL=1
MRPRAKLELCASCAGHARQTMALCAGLFFDSCACMGTSKAYVHVFPTLVRCCAYALFRACASLVPTRSPGDILYFVFGTHEQNARLASAMRKAVELTEGATERVESQDMRRVRTRDARFLAASLVIASTCS